MKDIRLMRLIQGNGLIGHTVEEAENMLNQIDDSINIYDESGVRPCLQDDLGRPLVIVKALVTTSHSINVHTIPNNSQVVHYSSMKGMTVEDIVNNLQRYAANSYKVTLQLPNTEFEFAINHGRCTRDLHNFSQLVVTGLSIKAPDINAPIEIRLVPQNVPDSMQSLCIIDVDKLLKDSNNDKDSASHDTKDYVSARSDLEIFIASMFCANTKVDLEDVGILTHTIVGALKYAGVTSVNDKLAVLVGRMCLRADLDTLVGGPCSFVKRAKAICKCISELPEEDV